MAGAGRSELKGQVHWGLDPASEEKMQQCCVSENGRNSKSIQPSEEWPLCGEETVLEGSWQEQEALGKVLTAPRAPLVSPIDRHWQGAAGEAEVGLVAFQLMS